MTAELTPAARLAAGAAIIRDAGKLALDFFHDRARLAVEKKGAQDFVSEADRTVEQAMRAALGRCFPGEAILGEEGGGGEAQRLWIIDPIDGTHNFLRGVPYWSVTLAYVEDGEAQIGLIYDPTHDELFSAARGRGATRDGQAITASAVEEADAAAIGLSFSLKSDHGRYLALIEAVMQRGMDHKRYGSSALSLCHLADARLDAIYCAHTHSWDVLAGLLIVEESGGYAQPFNKGGSLLSACPSWASSQGLRSEIATLLDGLPG